MAKEVIQVNEKLDWMIDKIEEFSSIALLKRAPKIRIVKELPAEAKTSFWKKDILIRQDLISKLEKNQVNQDYIETVLAHEMGHVIDLYRELYSAYLQLCIVVVLGFFSLIICGVLALLANRWLGILSIFVGGTFLLGAYRNRQRASEFRAEKSAFQLIYEKSKIVKTYKPLMEKQQAILAGKYGQNQKLKMMLQLLFFPSFEERLRELGLKEN
jgi:Zn-dependent protease with chaperone function